MDRVSALPSLTAAQAAERSRLLSVERYDLDVDVVGLRAGPELRADLARLQRVTDDVDMPARSRRPFGRARRVPYAGGATSGLVVVGGRSPGAPIV